jgi:carboxylesterase type B
MHQVQALHSKSRLLVVPRNPFSIKQLAKVGLNGQGMSTSYAANNTVRAIELAGCDYHGADSQKSLECLRTLPVEKLTDIEAQIGQQFAALAGLDAFGRVVDGDFFPDVPSGLFKSGRFTKVPMIIGWNEDDRSFFAPATVATQEDLVAFLLKLVPGF